MFDTSRTTGRRTVLRGMTAGIGTAAFGTQTTRSQNPPTVEYPKLVSGDTVVEYISVPEDWDHQRRRASRTLSSVRDRFERIEGVRATELTRTDETFGGHPGLEISVIVDPESNARRQLPEEPNGIPVSATAGETVFAASCSSETTEDNCTNNEKTNRVEGGQNLGWTEQANGTSCCRMTYNGERTTTHLWTRVLDGLQRRDIERSHWSSCRGRNGRGTDR